MFQHIINAAERLKGHANHTPVMTSGSLNKLVGADIYLKCENFQKIGAFKFRGAFNSISKLSALEKSKGVRYCIKNPARTGVDNDPAI
jgi:threonine dehydratase